jgi:hypothetical protein
MTRTRALLLVLASLVLAPGCGGPHTAVVSSTGPARRASTTAPHVGRHEAAAQFAATYVRFLDGAGSARELPDATPSVRALAARAGPVPAGRRRGMLMMTGLRPAVGEPGSYLLSARDDAHVVYAQMMLAERHGRWLVVELTAPDFVQVFASPGPPPPAPPHGSAGAQHAARLFLRGYLRWLYRHGSADVQSATRGLARTVRTHPPRVPLAMHALRPELVAIAMQRRHGSWQALANISDGSETYELVLLVVRTRGRWVVTSVGAAR